MKERSFAVIGLGLFGKTLACALADADCDVLAVDDKEENIQEVAEKVTYAVRADVREEGVLRSLGVQNVDVAVITISENMEASIVATMQAKELGVPLVMAKAINALHGRILDRVGADRVLYPEKSMGLRVAYNLTSSGYLDLFELSPEYSIGEFLIPKEWAGKSLAELHIREKYRINVLGLMEGEELNMNLDPREPLPEGCVVLAVGRNRDLNAVS